MRKRDLHRVPWYLQDILLVGFDEDPKKKKADDKSGDDDEESEEEDEDEESEEDDKDKDKSTDTTALKSALQKERKAAREAQRKLKAAEKKLAEKDDKDKSDTDKAKDDAVKANAKAERLAERLRDTAVDNVVIKLASKLKFRDVDDALKLVDRSEIDVEQDEDDPADVVIDEETVEAALKTLAKKKSHLIVADGQGDKSGSKFGGGRKTQVEMDEDALVDKYPALQRSRGQRQATGKS